MNQNYRDNNQTQREQNSKIILLVVVVIIVIIGAIVGIYFISQQKVTPSNNNVSNVNANLTTFRNVNGKVYCGKDSECPPDFNCVSVYRTNGQEERVCVKKEALNLNTNASFSPELEKTVKYQDKYHGISIQVPSDWSDQNPYNPSGSREGSVLLNASTKEGLSTLNVQVTFYYNDDPSLAAWVAKKKIELENEYQNVIQTKSEIDKNEAFFFSAQKTGMSQRNEFRYNFAYLQRGNKVYQILINGHKNLYDKNVSIINPIINSFKFIDTVDTRIDQVIIDDWKTVAYQKADHGFTIDLPADWKPMTVSSGFMEERDLITAYQHEGDSSLDFGISFFNNNKPTLSDWLREHQKKLEEIDRDLIKESKKINNLDYFIYTVRESGYNSERTYTYAYVQRDNIIYQLRIGGNKELYDKHQNTVGQILSSLTFIEVKPLLEIIEPSANVSINKELSYDIEVEWQDPEPMNFSDPMLSNPDNGIYQREYYKVGKVKNGRYQGMDLVNILEVPEGPGFGQYLYRVIYDSSNKTFTYLEKHSNNLSYFNTHFTYDVGSEIKGLDSPAEINIPNSEVSLKEELYNTNSLFSSYDNLEKLFDDSQAGSVYFDPNQKCFLIKTIDGLVKLYHLRPNFVENFAEGEYILDSSRFIPNIFWLDSLANTDEYTYDEPLSGCGSRNCHAIFTDEELGGEEVLKVTGETSTGEKVYEYKDDNHEVLKETYDNYYVPSQEEKMSYEEFTKSHPLFYWKDPFGHWVRFKKNKFLPAVECGKPVIYLYPEVKTKVNVQVDPTGGFSLTEPEYPTGGWNVIANPGGRLEYSDGKQYPYLFWEGKGINYKIPEKGFVIAREEIKSFLSEKLIQLGLNRKESADFMEFWVPRMQEKPYYFITFIDQKVFNQLAPLKVTPEPDQVIRVFMDYQPLDQPVEVEPLKIITPERKGFTVVEWGGALHE